MKVDAIKEINLLVIQNIDLKISLYQSKWLEALEGKFFLDEMWKYYGDIRKELNKLEKWIVNHSLEYTKIYGKNFPYILLVRHRQYKTELFYFLHELRSKTMKAHHAGNRGFIDARYDDVLSDTVPD